MRVRQKDGTYRSNSNTMSMTQSGFEDAEYQAFLNRKKKAKHDKIAKYKEFKLSMQIELIE